MDETAMGRSGPQRVWVECNDGITFVGRYRRREHEDWFDCCDRGHGTADDAARHVALAIAPLIAAEWTGPQQPGTWGEVVASKNGS